MSELAKAAKQMAWASANLEEKLKERAALDEELARIAHNMRINDHAVGNARMGVQGAREELNEELAKVS